MDSADFVFRMLVFVCVIRLWCGLGICRYGVDFFVLVCSRFGLGLLMCGLGFGCMWFSWFKL